ncbi:MAG TPA: class I SAM-dependent methyltransferase [Chthoniobacterales bacterium]
MSTKLIYRNPFLYELIMRLLYGRHYQSRSQVIADLIEPGSSVVDLCCGAGLLYHRYLRRKNVAYTGLDVSHFFVDALKKQGVRAMEWDLQSAAALPQADYVTMQSSLCYFLPDPRPVIDRMLNAAMKRVIIAEPIRNLSTSKLPLVASVAVKLSGPGGGHSQRFNEQSLDELFAAYSSCLKLSFKIPGGREKVYVLNGNRSGAHSPQPRK